MSDCPHGDKIGELEAEVERRNHQQARSLERFTQVADQRDEAQAQLRDAQGTVAALVKGIKGNGHDQQHPLSTLCALCELLNDLPAASKATLAAAEREQGLKEALEAANVVLAHEANGCIACDQGREERDHADDGWACPELLRLQHRSMDLRRAALEGHGS